MADILIVEDDRAMLRGLEENLAFEGHVVRHVLRGDEALGRLAANRPDLLILDVMLPGLSGFEICRQVRRADRSLPILMLTARGEDVDKVMGLDLGADDYLTKPFSLSELLARVRALLRRSAPGDGTRLPDAIAFGDVAVDFVRFTASRQGAPVHLTAKEFAILRQLAAAAGAAVSRDTLMDRVWGDDVNVTNRTVDTHLLSLRQKLEPDPGNPRHLVTVHGIGYRFVNEA
jgi:DNA-binding response OmpR family regulator